MLKKYRSIIYIIIFLLFICLMFYLSNQDNVDSGSLSMYVTKKFLMIFYSSKIKEAKIDIDLLVFKYNIVFRKIAHVFIYFILTFIVYKVTKVFVKSRNVIISYIVCLIIAISDELYQFHIPGRICSLNDVLIDNIGIILMLLLIKINEKRKIIK